MKEVVMERKFYRIILQIAGCLLLAGNLLAQSSQSKSNRVDLHEIRLKSRIFTPTNNALQKGASALEAGHVLIQFENRLTDSVIGLLQNA